MTTSTVWIVIVVIGAGSLAMRAAFLVLPTFRGEVSETAKKRLALVPPAAFAALVAPSFLTPEGELDLFSPALVAGVTALAVALKCRSLALTIITGLVAYVVALQLWP
jgi:branched-subunit amino acid transport protein